MSYFIFYCKLVICKLISVWEQRANCFRSFTCDYVVSVRKGFLYLLLLVLGYVISLWYSLGLPYNYLRYVTWRKSTFLKTS